jgi:putative solute:sodium symporter small subunit|tara:strand:- start:8595 stop:8870 length:276 start_codon:yes stop_codon:yes gene_type:complete
MKKDYKMYWKKNVRLLIILLSIWFTVSFLLGIVFSEQLDKVTFFGFKLGFWISQQGAIVVYITIIFVYVKKMKKLDKEFGISDEPEEVAEH